MRRLNKGLFCIDSVTTPCHCTTPRWVGQPCAGFTQQPRLQRSVGVDAGIACRIYNVGSVVCYSAHPTLTQVQHQVCLSTVLRKLGSNSIALCFALQPRLLCPLVTLANACSHVGLPLSRVRVRAASVGARAQTSTSPWAQTYTHAHMHTCTRKDARSNEVFQVWLVVGFMPPLVATSFMRDLDGDVTAAPSLLEMAHARVAKLGARPWARHFVHAGVVGAGLRVVGQWCVPGVRQPQSTVSHAPCDFTRPRAHKHQQAATHSCLQLRHLAWRRLCEFMTVLATCGTSRPSKPPAV